MKTQRAGRRGQWRSLWAPRQDPRRKRLALFRRPLRMELLEDRRLLSGGPQSVALEAADVVASNGLSDEAVGGHPEKTIAAGEHGDDVVDLIVTQDGVSIDTDGAAVTGYILGSAGGIFTGEPADNLGLFVEDTDFRIGGNMGFTLNGTHLLGDVIGDEFDDVNLFEDLTFTYVLDGVPGIWAGTLILADWEPLVDVAVIPVLTPSPPSLPGSALPTPVDTVPLDGTYYLEVWVQDTGSPGAGIAGGTVDVHYTTSLADAVGMVHLDFDVLPSGSIDDANGLVDDLGGGTLTMDAAMAPDWARLAYVEVAGSGTGMVTFDLSPGAFQFSRTGVGNVEWNDVNLTEVVTVAQIGETRIDMTLVREPTAFDDLRSRVTIS